MGLVGSGPNCRKSATLGFEVQLIIVYKLSSESVYCFTDLQVGLWMSLGGFNKWYESHNGTSFLSHVLPLTTWTVKVMFRAIVLQVRHATLSL